MGPTVVDLYSTWNPAQDRSCGRALIGEATLRHRERKTFNVSKKNTQRTAPDDDGAGVVVGDTW